MNLILEKFFLKYEIDIFLHFFLLLKKYISYNFQLILIIFKYIIKKIIFSNIYLVYYKIIYTLYINEIYIFYLCQFYLFNTFSKLRSSNLISSLFKMKIDFFYTKYFQTISFRARYMLLKTNAIYFYILCLKIR